MNLFGNTSADGNGKLVRQLSLTGGLVIIIAMGAASYLDSAAKNGFAGLSGNASRILANVPKPAQATGGIRYGNVDYMPTASIPASQQRVKNVLSDTSLGMPN